MYAVLKVEDTVRILPELFGEDLDKVVEEIVQQVSEDGSGLLASQRIVFIDASDGSMD